jgi:hypothetical protein
MRRQDKPEDQLHRAVIWRDPRTFPQFLSSRTTCRFSFFPFVIRLPTGEILRRRGAAAASTGTSAGAIGGRYGTPRTDNGRGGGLRPCLRDFMTSVGTAVCGETILEQAVQTQSVRKARRRSVESRIGNVVASGAAQGSIQNGMRRLQ